MWGAELKERAFRTFFDTCNSGRMRDFGLHIWQRIVRVQNPQPNPKWLAYVAKENEIREGR